MNRRRLALISFPHPRTEDVGNTVIADESEAHLPAAHTREPAEVRQMKTEARSTSPPVRGRAGRLHVIGPLASPSQTRRGAPFPVIPARGRRH